MQILDTSPTGHRESTLEGDFAFLPDPLPRELPLSGRTVYLLERASIAVGTLAGVGETLPNPHLLIRPFLRREAVLSSKIEGTQASLSDLFLFERTGKDEGDTREVANYVSSLEGGLKLFEGLPICIRLLNELHNILLRGSGVTNIGREN